MEIVIGVMTAINSINLVEKERRERDPKAIEVQKKQDEAAYLIWLGVNNASR